MNGVRRGVRPFDVALTAALVGLAAWMMVVNVQTSDPTLRVDSRSWVMIPVFMVAFVPVLWWRRDPVIVVVVAVLAMGVHDLAFGHVVRCGAGLPLSFVLAFLCGLGLEGRRRWAGLALVAVLGALVLVWDTAAGPGLIPAIVAIQVVLWGIGRVVASRASLVRELAGKNRELSALRDERAGLEVSGDRLRVSQELEALLERRLGLLEAQAEAGAASDDPERARQLLAELEHDSRRTLDDMREIVGSLRGGEVSLAPSPTVAHLDGLLGRRHLRSPLRVTGDPRVLPASVELSAYRIVEHLLAAVADDPDAPVQVSLGFTDDALEIRVSGPVPRGSDLRGALARARERAHLHAGTLEARSARGRTRVVAHLPVLGA